MVITKELLAERLNGLVVHHNQLLRQLDQQAGAIADCEEIIRMLSEPEPEQEPES